MPVDVGRIRPQSWNIINNTERPGRTFGEPAFAVSA